MNPFEMVVLIVAIVMVASVLKARYRTRDEEDAPRPDAASREETERLRAELHALRTRVATLERIATDGATRLEHEIEALRDRP